MGSYGFFASSKKGRYRANIRQNVPEGGRRGLAEEYAGVLPSYHELEFLGAELSRRGPALKIDAAQPDHATKTVKNKVLMKGLQTLSRFHAFTLPRFHAFTLSRLHACTLARLHAFTFFLIVF